MPPFSSPFPTTSSKPGHGSVVLSLLPPATPTFTTLSYTYPLKLLPSTPHTIPRPPPTSSPSPPVDHTSKPTKTEPAEPPHGTAPTREDNNDSSPLHSTHTNHAPPPAAGAPPPAPQTCPLLFLLTYGGGLLAGDAITLSLRLNAGTRLVVATQGMGKVFPPAARPSTLPSTSPSASPPAPSTQHITSTILAHAALWLAPDATQPFAHSEYVSHQVFNVAPRASLGVVEWVNQGRAARGEEWGMRGWRSRDDVVEGGRLVVRDCVVLEDNKRSHGDDGEEGQEGGEEVKNRMDGMGVVGTLILLGPVFESLAGFFVGEFEGLERIGGRDWGGGGGGGVSDDGGVEGGGDDEKKQREERRRERWRAGRQRMESEQGVVWTACHVRGRKCCVVKFMAREMQGARDWLGGMLREEGTVGREFGEGGLMFVR